MHRRMSDHPDRSEARRSLAFYHSHVTGAISREKITEVHEGPLPGYSKEPDKRGR